MCRLLAPVPGSWPWCLLSHPLPAQRPAKPAPRSQPHTLRLSGAVHLAEQGVSCAAVGCGSSPHCSLRSKWGAKLHEGLPHSGQFWLRPAWTAALQVRRCAAECTSHRGQASTPNQMSFPFSLMRQTSLFSHHNMWF